MGAAKAHRDGIKAFAETDVTEDLKIINVPTLVMHGDDDQIVPIADSAPVSAKLLKNGTLKVYKSFPPEKRSAGYLLEEEATGLWREPIVKLQ
jgi:non-heme chloroperoxidase